MRLTNLDQALEMEGKAAGLDLARQELGLYGYGRGRTFLDLVDNEGVDFADADALMAAVERHRQEWQRRYDLANPVDWARPQSEAVSVMAHAAAWYCRAVAAANARARLAS